MKYAILIVGLILTIVTLLYFFKPKQEPIESVNRLEAPSIHSLNAKSLLEDKDIPLTDYKGKVLLIVNTASKCGLTPQYKDLQALHEEFANDGLAVLGFPSNDFLSQEPGTEEEIATFCEKNYGVEFDMFEKVKVKGDKHPIYQFLTEKEQNGVLDSKVSWNFQKYLLDKDGKLVTMISPRTKVTNDTVRSQIIDLLK